MSEQTPPSPLPPQETSRFHSLTIGKIAFALAAAQGAINTAAKNENNPHFGKSYADLADVWDACRRPLASNNLAVVQLPGSRNDGKIVTLVTILAHGESGEFFCSTLEMVPSKNDPQGIGSTLTYMRRYALSAIVGVAPKDDDDDGNAGSGRGQPPQGQGARPQGQAPRAPSNAAPPASKNPQTSGAEPKVPAEPPAVPEAAKPFVKRFEEVPDEAAFRKLLESTRETFEKGTPEHKAFNVAVMRAAKRLGIEPKKEA